MEQREPFTRVGQHVDLTEKGMPEACESRRTTEREWI